MAIDEKVKSGVVDKIVEHIKKLGVDKELAAKLTPAWDGKSDRRKKDSVDSFFEDMEAELTGK